MSQDHPLSWPFVGRFEAHSKPVNSLSFRQKESSNGIISGGEDNVIIALNYKKPSHCDVIQMDQTGIITDIDHSPNDNVFAVASTNGNVKYCEANLGGGSLTFKAHSAPISSISFSVDSDHLLTASLDKTVKLWKNETQKEIICYKVNDDIVTCAHCSHANPNLLAIGSKDKTVRVMDLRLDEKHPVIMFSTPQGVNSVNLHQIFENLLAVATDSGSVRIYDLKKNALNQHYTYHQSASGVFWHPQELLLISCGREGNVNLFDISKGKHLIQARDHEGPVNCVKFSPNGKSFASTGEDNYIVVRKAKSS